MNKQFENEGKLVKISEALFFFSFMSWFYSELHNWVMPHLYSWSKGPCQWPPLAEAEKFQLMPMGVLTPGTAHAKFSARPPIDMSGNFPAHVSAESPSNISPNPSEVISEVLEP